MVLLFDAQAIKNADALRAVVANTANRVIRKIKPFLLQVGSYFVMNLTENSKSLLRRPD
jgi:hypothetical protein